MNRLHEALSRSEVLLMKPEHGALDRRVLLTRALQSCRYRRRATKAHAHLQCDSRRIADRSAHVEVFRSSTAYLKQVRKVCARLPYKAGAHLAFSVRVTY